MMMSNGLRSAAVLSSALLCLATGVARGQQFYDDPDWAKYGVSTHPLNLSSTPQGTGVQDSSVVYTPARIWDVDAIPAPHHFEGYKWVKETYTDSAAAATALATGRKSYNNAINWSDLDAPITPTIIEFAAARGMKTGTISSVQWSHATPMYQYGVPEPATLALLGLGTLCLLSRRR